MKKKVSEEKILFCLHCAQSLVYVSPCILRPFRALNKFDTLLSHRYFSLTSSALNERPPASAEV